jgi:hypothetical protein
VVADALTRIDQAIPAPDSLVEEFRRRRADVVMLASATNPGGPQLDHLKAAMAMGARSIISVWSWDHLSGKAWLRLVPNRVLVWNATQRDEVTQLHGLPDDCVTVTGAQCYDQWFGRTPSRTRDAFFAAHDLDPSKDLLLYVCSVLVRPAPDEAPFVREWIRQVRASDDPRLRDANILIRPHPERLLEWDHVDLSGLGRVAVAGRNPVDRKSRDEYFDSLYFSRLVVGLVTSAFLEAAVVGRPVFTVMKPEFRLFQMGTPHFRYLVTLESGLLHTADDWPEHLRQLAAAFDDEAAERERLRRFVEAFVRPRGLERAATPDFVEAVERVIEEPPQPLEHAALVPGAMPAVAHLLRRALTVDALKPVLFSRHDLEYEAVLRQHRAEVAATKSRIEAGKTAYREGKAAQKVRAVRARDRERRAKAWSRWRRSLSARKQLARLKGTVKHMMGEGSQ